MAATGVPRSELRPQAVLLTFFGDYLDATDRVVSSASVVELLDAVGVGEHAARATLSRMVRRGLLRRESVGRRAYFGLTGFGLDTVRDGRARALAHDDRASDGTWTLVAYSLPDDAQRERHALRAALGWAGFGMVQAGLWAAPRRVDVAAALTHLGLGDGVQVFTAVPSAPTQEADLVRQAFDVSTPALRYQEFLDRWGALEVTDPGSVSDPLAARVVLATDWLQVIREDPRLPERFLGPGWPGDRAGELYRRLDGRLRPLAEREAARRLDVRGPEPLPAQ